MTKEGFLKTYANLPERERIIIVINDKTYSWNVAYSEISNGTGLGEEILKKIEILEIL